MTTFAQLFPQGPRADDAPSTTYDDHHTVRRLTDMIGDPRDELDMVSPRSRTRLSQLVADAEEGPAAAPEAPADVRKRPRRRLDLFSAASAALAIVALAAAGIVAGVQTANADPAGDAMQSLRADEESIQSAENALAARRERLTEDLATSTTDAAALRAAVDGAREAPDPRQEPTDETVTVLDAAKADEIVAEIDRYTVELQAMTLPEPPAAYDRADVDERSLEDVGAAIGAAGDHLTVLDEAAAALRDAKAAVDAIEATHAANLEALAAGFTALGEIAIEENPDAEEELQTAVTAAAQAVVDSKLQGAGGTAAVTTYRDAVVALIADQLRVEAERPRGGQQEQPQPGPGESTPSEPTTEPTAPPEEPNDPVVIPPFGGGDGGQGGGDGGTSP